MLTGSVAAVSATLLTASTALGATVSRDGGFVQFSAAAGENNALTVSYETSGGGALLFDDANNAITADAGGVGDATECVADGDNVRCAAVGSSDTGFDVFSVDVDLGDGTNSVSFSNPPARAVNGDTLFFELTGGPAADAFGGAAEGTAFITDVEYAGRTNALTITADGVANDGEAGEGDNVSPDTASISGGDGGDLITGSGRGQDLLGRGGDDTLNGGDGDDFVIGNNGNDRVNGEGGEDFTSGGLGNDEARGGPGDDSLSADFSTDADGNPNTGADLLDGGDGLDDIFYSRSSGLPPNVTALPVNVTLDGVANDGSSGEGDNVIATEYIGADAFFTGTGRPADDTLIGAAGFQGLFTDRGNDTQDGGADSDSYFAGSDNDTIRARDGAPDLVFCGEGTTPALGATTDPGDVDSDTAIVDQFDTVGSDCENVQRADVQSQFQDRQPTVALGGPAPGSRIPANTPTTLTATASDDRGVTAVVFLDDDRQICVDTTAPYTCVYQPRGEDVGRNTLAVVALDAGGQGGFATRTVVVPRFTGTLSASLSPSRDVRPPFRTTARGRLSLPATVGRALGCTGVVNVQVKAGARTLSTRRVRLRSDCSFSSTTSIARGRTGTSRRLKVTARFQGNEVVAEDAAPSRNLRIR